VEVVDIETPMVDVVGILTPTVPVVLASKTAIVDVVVTACADAKVIGGMPIVDVVAKVTGIVAALVVNTTVPACATAQGLTTKVPVWLAATEMAAPIVDVVAKLTGIVDVVDIETPIVDVVGIDTPTVPVVLANRTDIVDAVVTA
jgi:hypothetical protein